jgi:hypothetical protein
LELSGRGQWAREAVWQGCLDPVNGRASTVRTGQRVGINRPDLQFDYNGHRYHVEYDIATSSRGSGHQSRITSNDPNAVIILLIVP